MMTSPENAANAEEVNLDILGKTPGAEAGGKPEDPREEELKKNELRYMDMNNKDLLKKVLTDCNYIVPSLPQSKFINYGEEYSEYSKMPIARSRNVGSQPSNYTDLS